MRKIWKLSIIAALSAAATSANAAPSERPQVAINFSKTAALTLSGRAALDRRIHRAAAMVCDTGTGTHFVDARCVAEAETRAKGELDVRLAAISSPVQIATK